MDMVGMKVLVTGGAGFLGAHLVRALLKAGATVRVLDDFSSGAHDRLAKLPVEVVAGDVRDAETARRAVAGAALVLHLAGRSLAIDARPSELRSAEDVNVGGALVLLDAAWRERARTVVAGSGAVYGRTGTYVLHEDLAPKPQTPRAVQHLAVEHHARVLRERHGAEVVVLRLFRCFGPGERPLGDDAGARGEPSLVPQLCQAALGQGQPRIVGDGRQTRDLVYVDDAVAALLAAGRSRLGAGAAVYNVASGEAVSVLAVWAELARAAGLATGVGDAQPSVEYLPERPWEPPHFRVSIARARRDFGYVPAVSLRDGLQRCLEHYGAAWREVAVEGRERAGADANQWFAPHDDEPKRRAPPPLPPRATSSSSGLRLPAPSARPTAASDEGAPGTIEALDDWIEAVEVDDDPAEGGAQTAPASKTAAGG